MPNFSGYDPALFISDILNRRHALQVSHFENSVFLFHIVFFDRLYVGPDHGLGKD